MTDFLSDNNPCGQSLLALVSKGNVIIADILRMKNSVPDIFRVPKNKYSDVIQDFSYFNNADTFEENLEKSQVLSELDEELNENYQPILAEFFDLFESVYSYITEVNKFIEDIEELYLTSVDSVFTNLEGGQLLCESVYLYGLMLLLIDENIEGIVRERMLTSFYRFSGGKNFDTNVDDVCKLFRTTGKKNYPVDYFSRLAPEKSVIKKILKHLKSADLYNSSNYPDPSQRSTALSQQASLITIVLFFTDSLNDLNEMKEIVDRFYFDSFVIPVYISVNFNLCDWWSGFKTVKLLDKLKLKSIPYGTRVDDLTKDLEHCRKDLSEEFLLEKSAKILDLVREGNVIFRWLLLHCNDTNPNRKSKQILGIVTDSKFDRTKLLTLLVSLSKLEKDVKLQYRELLKKKETTWLEMKKEAKERLVELSQVFSGNRPLTRIEKNDKLSVWFDTKVTHVDSLNYDELNLSCNKITVIVKALRGVLEYHNLYESQAKDWLNDVIKLLQNMIRVSNLNEDLLISMQIIGDMGYAFGLIKVFNGLMKQLIVEDPQYIDSLRDVFLKISNSLDIPLLRLGKSKDLMRISQFYSRELVNYMQEILQIIPESVLSILDKIIHLQTNLKEIPTRLDKDKVKEYSFLQERFQVASLTNRMSVQTQSLLKMQSTLLGTVWINPKKLLENGLRKELIRLLTDLFDFKSLSTLPDVKVKVEGIKRSFEYIGDYVGVVGLKVYYEELSRLVNFNLESATNHYQKTKILPMNSIYQSKEVPIVLKDESFLNKVLLELLNLSDYKTNVYVSDSWCCLKTHVLTLGHDIFQILFDCFDAVGVFSLYELLGFVLCQCIRRYLANAKSDITNLQLVSLIPEQNSKLIINAAKQYATWHGKYVKNNELMKIGQLQLLRKRLVYILRVQANFHAKYLYSSFSHINSLLAKEKTDDLTFEVQLQSELLGLTDPINKIYVTTNPIQYFSFYLALSVSQMLKKCLYSPEIGTFAPKKSSENVDCYVMTMGVVTVLNNLSISNTYSFLNHFAQYYNSIANCGEVTDLGACHYFLKLFIRFSKFEVNTFVHQLVPCLVLF